MDRGWQRRPGHLRQPGSCRHAGGLTAGCSCCHDDVVSSGDQPRSARRRLSPQERRSELLDAATALVIEADDLGAATLERVAMRAGCSRNLAYTYFGNREGLLDALADRERAFLVERLSAGDPPRSARAWVRHVVELLLEGVSERGPLIVMLFDRSPRSIDREGRQVLAAIIAGKLQDAGLDPRPAAVTAPILGAAMAGAAGSLMMTDATVDEVLTVVDQLVDGLLGPAERTGPRYPIEVRCDT